MTRKHRKISYNPLKSWMAWIGFILGLIILGLIYNDPFVLFIFPIQAITISILIIAVLVEIKYILILLPIVLFFIGYVIHLAFKKNKKVGFTVLIFYIMLSIIKTIIFNKIVPLQ